MILFATAAQPEIERHHHPNLGRLIQPRHFSSIVGTAASGVPWAADNDAFNSWGEVEADRFRRMLDAAAGLPRCRFVAAPDVVGEWELTLYQYEEWAYEILARRLPVAVVLQDGIEEIGEVPWGACDAIFLGGTDAFKLGTIARACVVEAKRRGKWAHMGRVNSAKRIAYAKTIGCDSIDGLKWSRWRGTWLKRGLDLCSAGEQLAFT